MDLKCKKSNNDNIINRIVTYTFMSCREKNKSLFFLLLFILWVSVEYRNESNIDEIFPFYITFA